MQELPRVIRSAADRSMLPTTVQQVLPPGMSGAGLGSAPSGAIPNQGEWFGLAASGAELAGLCPHAAVARFACHALTPAAMPWTPHRAASPASRCSLGWPHSSTAVCPLLPVLSFTGLHRVDTMGKLMSPTTMKRRGLQASTRAPVWMDTVAAPAWLRLCGCAPPWGFWLRGAGSQCQ